MKIERSPFLIDEAGNIKRTWRHVRPGGHTKSLSELVDGGPSNHASNYLGALRFPFRNASAMALGISASASTT
jgi:hypothetical protein